MQLKREAKLLTVIGFNTKHADCRLIFMLNPIRWKHTKACNCLRNIQSVSVSIDSIASTQAIAVYDYYDYFEQYNLLQDNMEYIRKSSIIAYKNSKKMITEIIMCTNRHADSSKYYFLLPRTNCKVKR